MNAEKRMPTKRPPGVSRRLAFRPDPDYEWGLWIEQNDPAQWARINERARKAVAFYRLARAAWLGDDRVPTDTVADSAIPPAATDGTQE